MKNVADNFDKLRYLQNKSWFCGHFNGQIYEKFGLILWKYVILRQTNSIIRIFEILNAPRTILLVGGNAL